MTVKLSDFPAAQRQKIVSASPGAFRHHQPERKPSRIDRYRSDWERQYAAHLDLLKAAGEIAWWGYECITLHLGGGAKYKPDFVVQEWDHDERTGNFFTDYRFHEVKGHRREAGIVRLKVAAGMYPFRFFIVTKDGTGWKVEEARK